jgi:hypothetical protein
MSDLSSASAPPQHTVKTEPKHCRCRVCHVHFYAETIAAAREACLAHAEAEHASWGTSACYCPD